MQWTTGPNNFALPRPRVHFDLFPSVRPLLAFAGGHTAGHIAPALAAIDWLRAHGPECEFLFLGTPAKWERELVTQAGVPFAALPAVPWVGQRALTRLGTLARMIPAILAARRRLRAAHATTAIGLGSFASFAPVIAARSLGLPVTLFEPNAISGLATRLARPFARVVLVSRLYSGPRSPGRIVETGVPLPRALTELTGSPPPPPGERLRVLVLGGSLGNPFLNERMPEVACHLRAMRPAFALTHQCGHGVDPRPLAGDYAAAGIEAEVVSFLPSLAAPLRAASFVVTAAGAISLHEVAAAGVPALVVPLDHGGGAHQLNNAAAFARLTDCPVLTHREWSPARVADEIHRTVGEPACWRRRQIGLRALAASEGTAAFATAILPR